MQREATGPLTSCSSEQDIKNTSVSLDRRSRSRPRWAHSTASTSPQMSPLKMRCPIQDSHQDYEDLQNRSGLCGRTLSAPAMLSGNNACVARLRRSTVSNAQSSLDIRGHSTKAKSNSPNLNLLGLPCTTADQPHKRRPKLPSSLTSSSPPLLGSLWIGSEMAGRIDFGALARNYDNRTSVVIENLPSDVSQLMLQTWLDDTYDFLWSLPISDLSATTCRTTFCTSNQPSRTITILAMLSSISFVQETS